MIKVKWVTDDIEDMIVACKELPAHRILDSDDSDTLAHYLDVIINICNNHKRNIEKDLNNE